VEFIGSTRNNCGYCGIIYHDKKQLDWKIKGPYKKVQLSRI
jgi:hypothetical protein